MHSAVVCVVLSSVLLCGTAAAWNCAGHMITTQIALQLLPKNASNFFQDISAYQQMYYPRLTSLTEVSCWPDDMKSYTNEYSTWHYYDQCLLRANGTNLTCPIAEGDLPSALASARAQLSAAGNLTRAEQAFWLAFLVHLVGDFHQPLHVTTLFDPQFPNGDLGGNRFYIYVNGTKTNLHAFHDNIGWLLPSGFPKRPLAEYPDDQTMIEQLSESLILLQKFAYPAQPYVTNTTIWLEEGFEVGSTISYSLPGGAPLPFNATFAIDSEYVQNLRSMLQNRLALGGYRLATIMLDVFNKLHES